MGHLTIGASDTVTSQFLLPYLDSFHKQYPAIHIQIVSGRSHKVLGLLQSGKVDIAFASTPNEGSFETIPCFATHSIFVASPDYPCDFNHIYTLAEIADFPLILLERKASSRLYLEKYFLQNGLRLNPEIELGTEPAGGSGGHRLRRGGRDGGIRPPGYGEWPSAEAGDHL